MNRMISNLLCGGLLLALCTSAGLAKDNTALKPADKATPQTTSQKAVVKTVPPATATAPASANSSSPAGSAKAGTATGAASNTTPNAASGSTSSTASSATSVKEDPYSLKRLPGNSLASLRLQQDALPMVMATATGKNKTCKPKNFAELNIEDTVVETKPRMLGYLGKFPVVSPWREVWTVSVCGKPIPVPVDFIPDKDPRTGTTFVVNDGKK